MGGDLQESQETQTEKGASPESLDTTAASLSSTEKTKGAPRKRGPRGPFTVIRRIFGRPSVTVWAPVVTKVAGIAAVLAGVTFLGKYAETAESFGLKIETVAQPQSAKVAPVKKEGRSSAAVAGHKATDTLLATKKSSAQAGRPVPCGHEKKKQPSGVLPDGRVVLNEANANEMTRLPAVGPARGEAIVKLRERLGRFRKLSDLLRVRGIGWKTLKKMREKVILDRPSEKETEKSKQSKPEKIALK